MTATRYVAGFLFDLDAAEVVLIKKRRPRWQAGRLNGVGGHIEPGETSAEAMRREFREEAGLDIDTWEHFATVCDEGAERFSVEFFRAFVPACTLLEAKAQTDERIYRLPTQPLAGAVLPNLRWLVPLAAYTHDRYIPVVAAERRTP